ncbi:MAG: hypothetical protein AAGF11_00420 [Myxococcota bacterium]
MPLTSPGKLEKLQIVAFSDRDRTMRIGMFEAMFNPESFSLSYSVVYAKVDAMGSGGQQTNFVHSERSPSSITLTLDGTGYAETGSPGSQLLSVADRVEQLLDLGVRVNGSTHEPNFLRLQWGRGVIQKLDCRIRQLECRYTLFARDGSPLRAEVTLSFDEDKSNKKRAQEENRSSPDVSHLRQVRAGDTLPLMCQRIYGSSAHCTLVARANDLDDFRRLRPGQVLVFPPLE